MLKSRGTSDALIKPSMRRTWRRTGTADTEEPMRNLALDWVNFCHPSSFCLLDRKPISSAHFAAKDWKTSLDHVTSFVGALQEGAFDSRLQESQEKPEEDANFAIYQIGVEKAWIAQKSCCVD